jgi:hypothetical protein
MPDPVFITSSHVARICGFGNVMHFLRCRPALEDDHDFPLPMPMFRCPMKWRTGEVLAWLEKQGRSRADTQAMLPHGGQPAARLRVVPGGRRV